MTDRFYGGGGSIVGLNEALSKRIEEATHDLSLETREGDFVSPQVVTGFAPPPREEGSPKSPFIVAVPVKGDIGNDGYHRVKMGIVISVYSKDFRAADWLTTIASRIIRNLREKPTLADRYLLEYPIEWDMMFDEQPYPFWQIQMLTEFTIPAPVALPDEGVI